MGLSFETLEWMFNLEPTIFRQCTWVVFENDLATTPRSFNTSPVLIQLKRIKSKNSSFA